MSGAVPSVRCLTTGVGYESRTRMSYLTPRTQIPDASTGGRCYLFPTPPMGEVMRPHQLDVGTKRRLLSDRIVDVLELLTLGIATGFVVVAGFVPRARRRVR
jgi:hypothetical protein